MVLVPLTEVWVRDSVGSALDHIERILQRGTLDPVRASLGVRAETPRT